MPAHESDAAQEIAHSWSRTLIGVRDPKLQVAWVRERLVQLGAARAADVLTIVLARAEQREERYAVLLLRASLALAAPDLTGVKRAIACCAEARSQLGLARFLGARPVQAERTEGQEDGLEAAAAVTTGAAPYEEPSERTLTGVDPGLRQALESSKGRPLSLGERKSLARRRDRHVLARALRDPHPDVVRILLDNPALIEIDVVRLCARRPVQPEVLALVFAHERWIVRYRIRLALALNPHTPESIAVQLLPHLTPSDLRAVAQSGDISTQVRDACAAPTKRSIH